MSAALIRVPMVLCAILFASAVLIDAGEAQLPPRAPKSQKQIQPKQQPARPVTKPVRPQPVTRPPVSTPRVAATATPERPSGSRSQSRTAPAAPFSISKVEYNSCGFYPEHGVLFTVYASGTGRMRYRYFTDLATQLHFDDVHELQITAPRQNLFLPVAVQTGVTMNEGRLQIIAPVAQTINFSLREC